MRQSSRIAILTALCLGALCASAQAPNKVPITGNIGSITGTPSAYATMEIDLYNCPSPAVVTGYQGLVQTAAMVQADSSGNVSSTIWPNDVIDCNGTTGQSLYGVTYVVNGVPSGTPQCYSVLSTQQNWNIVTQQPVSCSGGPPNPQDLTINNLVVNGNLTLNQALASLAATSLNGALYVTGYGAKCDGTTDDTAAFQSATSAAAALYASKGYPVTVTYAGNCKVAGNVVYGSGVHLLGNGTILVPSQNGNPTFEALNADDIAWDNVNVVVTTSGADSPYNSAIAWYSDGSDTVAHKKVAVRNCRITGSAWGISVFAILGTGSLTDVDISGDTVSSATVYTNWDGIHVGGAVTNVTIANNRIYNRGDAGIGLTTESNSGVPRVLSGAKVSNNILLNDQVGLDNSGATNVEWTGNFVQATQACASCQNPAYRQIYYNGYPLNVHAHDNYLNSGNNSGASAAVKIDPAQTVEGSWPSLTSTFEKNIIDGLNAPLYVRGKGIAIEGNTFMQGGQFTLDYDGTNSVATANISIGTNKWMANGSLVAGAGCALYLDINVMPQVALGTLTLTNFSCLGTQTFNVLGNVTMGGTVTFTGSSFFQVFPGSTAPFSMNVRNISGANAFVLDATGNANFANGTVTSSSYMQAAGFNTPNGQVIPSGANGYHGTSAKVQFSDGTGASGYTAVYNTEGSVTSGEHLIYLVNQALNAPGSSTDSAATGSVSFSPAFADTSYGVGATVMSSGGAYIYLTVTSKSASSFGYAVTCTFNCGTIGTVTADIRLFHN